MLQIVDFRYEWATARIIICMKNCETNQHFYIYHYIISEEEGDEFVSFWQMYAIMFIDPTFQHPN